MSVKFRPELKLVESLPYWRRSLALRGDQLADFAALQDGRFGEGELDQLSLGFAGRASSQVRQRRELRHSLHYILPTNEILPPEAAEYFINRFTKVGEAVLDPFSVDGAVPLEASLMKRRAIYSVWTKQARHTTSAKLRPADLAEVALWLQTIHFRKPIDLSEYKIYFKNFYHPDTFREIWHLRQAVLSGPDRIADFVGVLAAGLLHGNTQQFLSAFTTSQVALQPSEQERLNFKRAESPEYRQLVPRLLSRVAHVARDGFGRELRDAATNSLLCGDPRDLTGVKSSSVALVLTTLWPGWVARPESFSWIREWFFGVTPKQSLDMPSKLIVNDGWGEFISEVIFELARVVSSGGRVVFALKASEESESILKEVVQNSSAGAFVAEGSFYLATDSLSEFDPQLARDLKNSSILYQVFRRK
ncbi:MAG TPA: hypothetical protein PKD37_03385 [Oligoflexia bacterium]|nr:hypothetical protein [Oligoflexia bacterium]HMP27012.1 hypothetical protein [Oligoflexia bacterium]